MAAFGFGGAVAVSRADLHPGVAGCEGALQTNHPGRELGHVPAARDDAHIYRGLQLRGEDCF